jgi:hypothetical protein
MPAFYPLINHLLNHAFTLKFSAELNCFPRISIIVFLSSSLSAHDVNPAGTAHPTRHHSGHRHSPRAASAPLSATSPGIPGQPRSRRPARLAATAIPEIVPAPETPETPQKPLFFPS